MRLSFTCLAFLAPLLAVARSSTGDKVLVVLDQDVQKDEYSKFWASLESRGYNLTFKAPSDKSADLTSYGERVYDHLIMYAPSAKTFSSSLSPQSILHAQLSGLNTLFLLSPSISDAQRDFMREYDLEIPSGDNTLLSPFSSIIDSPSSALIYPTPNPILSSSSGPVVFPESVSQTIGETPYLFPILSAPRGSYLGSSTQESGEAGVKDKKGGEAVQAGRAGTVVSAFQTRDNVRIGFVGSGKAAQDGFWEGEVKGEDGKKYKTANAAFFDDLTKWVFQETNVVKVVETSHKSNENGLEKAQYRKGEEITYSISLSTFSPLTSTWKPFHPPSSDLQLEFTMLDPFIRTDLVLDPNLTRDDAATYSATFKAPDRHGVFKFVVEWWRPGYTYIRSSTTTAVVPLRHDEHPRFITGAIPFYSAAISTSVAFVLFCGAWLSLGEERGRKKME